MKTLKRIVTIIMVIAMMITLVNPVTSEAASKKVKLNKTKATLTITDTKKSPTVTLKVTGTTKKATWTTSKKSVATVSSTGKVTAKKAGTATITCKVDGKKYTCKVTVTDKRTALNKTKATLTITDSNASPSVTLKVKNTTKAATWKSSDKNVATVSSAGKVTAKKAGTAMVTCKVNGVTLTCKITVVDNRTVDDSSNTSSDGSNSNGTKKPYGAIICWCGWRIEYYSSNGFTDEEEALHEAHLIEHLLKGEDTSYHAIKY